MSKAIWPQAVAGSALVAAALALPGGAAYAVTTPPSIVNPLLIPANGCGALTGAELSPPPSGPTLPAPKPKPKHHSMPKPGGLTRESVARRVQNVRTGRMIRLRRVAFLLPSALSRSLASSQSPYSA